MFSDAVKGLFTSVMFVDTALKLRFVFHVRLIWLLM